MQQNPWQPPPPPMSAPANVPNHLVWAILSTLFCCLPAGIVAIIYSSQVNTKIASGDMQGAMDASKNAKMWSMIAAGASLVVGIIYAIFMIFVVGMSAINQR